MGRPKGSKNKNKSAAAAGTSASSSGSRAAVKPPAPEADQRVTRATKARSRSRSRSGSGTVQKPDWSTLRFGILLGETKAIKKAFATQDDALGYVKSLPVTKQSKAKLVTVQALRVETSISILPAVTAIHPATPVTSTILPVSRKSPNEPTMPTVMDKLAADAPKASPAYRSAPAVTAAVNKATDTALRANKTATPAAKPPAPAASTAKGNGKSSRLDLIAARAAKLGHTPAGSAKADVLTVAATELAVDESEADTPEDPEEDAPDLSAE